MTCNQNGSPREKEILHLITYEYTTKEIASKLYISRHSADSHRKNLMQKLCVKNTVGLIRIGFQSGLLRLSSILLLIFLLGFQGRVSAAHTIWTGSASDHDWFNVANWDNGVPMAGDSATISIDSVIINNTTGIAELILLNGARLVVTPSGTLGLDNGARGIECTNSKIYNYGNIAITTPVFRGIELFGNSLMDNFSGSSVVIGQSLSNGAFYIDANATMNLRNNSIFVSFQNPTNSTNLGELRNRGILRIIETQTHALDNQGTIINRGLIEIDSTVEEGIINELSGKIHNYDTIRITRYGDDAIFSQDSLVNHPEGYIDIANASPGPFSEGIHNSHTGIVINDGVIQMKNVILGVLNSNNFFNRNKISVANSSNVSLSNSGLFSNANGALISFSNATSSIDGAISNFGSGFILNEGKLEISESLGYGIHNDAYIYNLDTIDISDTDGIGMINNDSLDNFSTGYIHIHDLHFGPNYGMDNTGTLTNDGKIRVYNVPRMGIENKGSLMNERLIQIDSAGGSGIVNDTGGVICNRDSIVIRRTSDASNGNTPMVNKDSIKNEMTGVILIADSNNSFGFKNSAGGTIINEGSMIIQDQIMGISHDGSSFNNFGSLDIVSIDGGISLSSPFINEETGSVVMGSVDGIKGSDSGIFVSGDGSLKNYGKIEVQEDFFRGIYISSGRIDNYDSLIVSLNTPFRSLLNQDTLCNHAGGTLLVDNSDPLSTALENAVTGYLSNSGKIQVMNLDRNCFLNSGIFVNDSLFVLVSNQTGIEHQGRSFINNANGKIVIQTADPAILNDSIMMNLGTILLDDVGSAIVNNKTLVNSDSIIVQGICDAGITNNGKIENQPGASIISTTDVPFGIDNKDTLQNDGFIFIDNPDKGIQNDNYIVNEDSISIRDNRIGLDNRLVTSKFINNGGLHIIEQEVSEHGILANGVISNNGSITVRDQRIEVLSTGTFDNNMGASISIILGDGLITSFLLIQNGGVVNGFPIIEILKEEE